MFCPSCGLEDKQSNQFCRACGTDLRVVRVTLAQPDSITASAASARDEIGRAFAAKIREAETAVDMKIIAEDVLPQIEKFLESPESRRLRRVRIGTIITAVGLGVTLLLLSFFIINPAGLFFPAAGLIVFFIGFAVVLNGLFFTIPPKTIADHATKADRQRELDARTTRDQLSTPTAAELILPTAAANYEFSSVIENTTQQLKQKQPIARQ